MSNKEYVCPICGRSDSQGGCDNPNLCRTKREAKNASPVQQQSFDYDTEDRNEKESRLLNRRQQRRNKKYGRFDHLKSE